MDPQARGSRSAQALGGDAAFQTVDRNRDGMVSREEFLAWFGQGPPSGARSPLATERLLSSTQHIPAPRRGVPDPRLTAPARLERPSSGLRRTPEARQLYVVW